jgi:hypothetical protein
MRLFISSTRGTKGSLTKWAFLVLRYTALVTTLYDAHTLLDCVRGLPTFTVVFNPPGLSYAKSSESAYPLIVWHGSCSRGLRLRSSPHFNNLSWRPEVRLLYPHCNFRLSKLWIVYALYGRSRKTALVLITSILIEYVVTIPFVVLYYQSLKFNEMCISTEISPRMLGIGFVPFALAMSGTDHHLQNPSRSV